MERFKNAKQDREKQIARAKEEIERCELERQKMLTAFRKGWATEAQTEIQSKAIKEKEEYWQEELPRLETLEANAVSVFDAYWNQVNQLRNYFTYDFFLMEPERKKEILNLLLQEFILYNNGKIELRFKLPVNEGQVAETVATLSHGKVV